MTGKTIRSFNADEDVNQLIKDADIPKGKLSSYINDKIRKGELFDKVNEQQDNKIEVKLLG